MIHLLIPFNGALSQLQQCVCPNRATRVQPYKDHNRWHLGPEHRCSAPFKDSKQLVTHCGTSIFTGYSLLFSEWHSLAHSGDHPSTINAVDHIEQPASCTTIVDSAIVTLLCCREFSAESLEQPLMTHPESDPHMCKLRTC